MRTPGAGDSPPPSRERSLDTPLHRKYAAEQVDPPGRPLAPERPPAPPRLPDANEDAGSRGRPSPHQGDALGRATAHEVRRRAGCPPPRPLAPKGPPSPLQAPDADEDDGSRGRSSLSREKPSDMPPHREYIAKQVSRLEGRLHSKGRKRRHEHLTPMRTPGATDDTPPVWRDPQTIHRAGSTSPSRFPALKAAGNQEATSVVKNT